MGDKLSLRFNDLLTAWLFEFARQKAPMISCTSATLPKPRQPVRGSFLSSVVSYQATEYNCHFVFVLIGVSDHFPESRLREGRKSSATATDIVVSATRSPRVSEFSGSLVFRTFFARTCSSASRSLHFFATLFQLREFNILQSQSMQICRLFRASSSSFSC